MKLNQSVEYALRATIYLVQHPEKTYTLREISEACRMPSSYLPTVLHTLAAKGVLISKSGYKGGYRLLQRAKALSLRDIVERVGGEIFENDCLLHGTPCAQQHSCPVHEIWEKAKEGFLEVMESYTLSALAQRVGDWEWVENFLASLQGELLEPKS